MSDLFDDEKQEEPLDPAIERVRVKLRRLLFGSSLIMAVGLVAVFSAIAYKLSTRGGDREPAYQVPRVVTEADLRHASYALPEGAQILTSVVEGNNLAVTYALPAGGGGVVLVDLASWQVYSVLRLPSK